MLLDDPRYDHLEHFGVKGMKWGVRRKIHARQKKHASKAKADAKELRDAADKVASGEGAGSKRMVKALRNYADDMDGVDDRAAKQNREYADAIESGKVSASHRDEQQIATLRGAARGREADAKSWEQAASRTQSKMDKLKADMGEPMTPEQKAIRKEKINTGVQIVAGLMLTVGTIAALEYANSGPARKAARAGQSEAQIQAGINKLFTGK